MAEARVDRENPTSTVFGNLMEEAARTGRASTADNGLVATNEDAPASGPITIAVKPNAKSGYIWFVLSGGIVALFWMAGVIAFSAGRSGLVGLAALPVSDLASLVFVTLGPAIFVFLAAVLIGELARFRGTAQTIGAMAERFADPAKATREDARKMTEAVHGEISRVNTAVEGALARLGAMEEVLGHHSQAFSAAEVSARERTDALINDLRREREAVADLATVLDQKAADIANAISEQSKMVVAAADIANAHAIDSTKTLEDSAERLSGSAHDAAQGAKVIAAKLDDATGKLSASTIVLGDTSRALDSSVSELDQVRIRTGESFAASRDEAHALSAIARKGVEEIESVARDGAGVITEAFEGALQKAHGSVREAQRDTQAAATRNARQAEELKIAAEEARNALDAYAEVIAKRLEQANEASFSAASWADKTFERLDAATQGLEAKLATLPQAADAQAQDLQDKLRRGLAGLNAAARSAADEAEEIDASFQARIRQNYELLSDFMLRMGSAADQRGGAMQVPSPFASSPRSVPAAETQTPSGRSGLRAQSGEDMAPGQSESEAAQPIVESNTARPDRDQAKDAKKGSAWRWKDVLSGMERSDEDAKPAQQPVSAPVSSPISAPIPAPVSAPAPAHTAERVEPMAQSDLDAKTGSDPLDRLVTLFRIHDIDPPLLFSTQVYRALSHARLVGGQQAMTDIVRMEAPVPVKALHDAFAEDAPLRSAAYAFAEELRAKIDEAAKKENRVHLETHLRTGDGPAYLLIETALL